MIKDQLARLSKGTSIYGIGQLVNRLIAFLLLPVFTAYLAPKDYGVISMLGFIGFLVSPIFKLGIGVSSGLLYFEGNDDSRKCQTVWTAFIILLISAGIMSTFGFIFSKQISYIAFQSDAYKDYTKLYIFIPALNILMAPLQQRLQFEERAKIFVILTVASSAVTICLNILFIVVLSRGIEGWILGTLMGTVFSFMLFFSTMIFSTKFRINFSLGKRLLKHGYPMIPSFAFLFIMQYSGRYILQRTYGLNEVGIYAIGYNLGMVMRLAVAAFTTAWYPFFQSFVHKKDKAKAVFEKVFTYYVLGFGALSILFFIFAKPVMTIMTKPAFHEAYKVIGMVALAQFFIGISSIFSPGIFYAKKIYLISVVQLISGIIVIILNLVLIPIFGFVGAAFAMMFGFIVMGSLQYGINIVKRFWIPEFKWARVAKISFLYIIIASFAVFLGINLPNRTYILTSLLLSSILALSGWMLLLRQERLFILQRFIRKGL